MVLLRRRWTQVGSWLAKSASNRLHQQTRDLAQATSGNQVPGEVQESRRVAAGGDGGKDKFGSDT